MAAPDPSPSGERRHGLPSGSSEGAAPIIGPADPCAGLVAPGPRDVGPAARPAPLLVFADDWGRHPSSSQHLVRRLRDHHPVLWVNSIGTRRVQADSLTLRRILEKLKNWRKGLTRVAERMWTVDLPMIPGLGNPVLRAFNRRLVTRNLRGILDSLGLADPIVLTTLPYMEWLIRDLPRRGTVYYCTDDYSHWPTADRATLQQADRDLTDRADLILAASRALFERHDANGRCRYFPHGVDHAHFASAGRPGDSIPEEVSRLPTPRIGFFGLIYEKLDFALLGEVARRFPGASLVMIGSVAWCPGEFASLPNVHLLGARPYAELPRYIAGLDVLLLPYLADDPMIRQSGPLKLRECLASGKPTVSVDVPEVRALEPHVRVAVDDTQFLGHIRDALAESPDPDRVAARRRSVEQDDWDSRAECLRSYLGGLTRAADPAITPGSAEDRSAC